MLVSAQTITVGFTVSKTGALNVDSLEQYRGFELWRDQTNAAGGIKAGGKSYQIQLVSYDDESNSKRVQQLYTRMILQDKADFTFSPYSSSLTATAAIVTVGKVSATVTLWLAGADWLPLLSVTCADTVAVPLASELASLEGIVAVQPVPAASTVAV